MTLFASPDLVQTEISLDIEFQLTRLKIKQIPKRWWNPPSPPDFIGLTLFGQEGESSFDLELFMQILATRLVY